MYELLPTKVSVAFYNRSSDWRGKIMDVLCLTNIHHCGIILHRKEGEVVLASDKTHIAKFVDAAFFHKHAYQPLAVLDLGESLVSLQQLTDFLYSHEKMAWTTKEPKPRECDYSYIGDARSIIFWFFVGRFIFPKLLPPSCALITCYLLRLCGFKIGNYVEPKTLYKELIHAINSNRWSSSSR